MIASHIELILIVTGALTAGAVLMFLAPVAVLRRVFDEAPASAVALLVARHWGLLVGLLGGLIVTAAFVPALRTPVLVAAIVEKLVLVLFLLGPSMRQRGRAASIAAGDLLMSIVYLLYLFGL